MFRNHWDDNCDDDKIDNPSCEKTVCRSFDVFVPVTVTPFAKPRKPNVRCLETKITPGHKCCKSRDNRFKFTITQKINVDIPVKFGAEVCFDEACSFDNGTCDKLCMGEPT